MAGHKVDVRVVRLAHAKGLPLPSYQTVGAAGLDLVAAVMADEPVAIWPGQRMLIPTGLKMELPRGYEAQVRPRSGLALKQGVTVLNSPGTIDADYRGEVQVILVNLGREIVYVNRGDRIAQMVIAPVVQATLVAVSELTQTGRGDGGFGSTLVSIRGGKKDGQAAAKARPAAKAGETSKAGAAVKAGNGLKREAKKAAAKSTTSAAKAGRGRPSSKA